MDTHFRKQLANAERHMSQLRLELLSFREDFNALKLPSAGGVLKLHDYMQCIVDSISDVINDMDHLSKVIERATKTPIPAEKPVSANEMMQKLLAACVSKDVRGNFQPYGPIIQQLRAMIQTAKSNNEPPLNTAILLYKVETLDKWLAAKASPCKHCTGRGHRRGTRNPCSCWYERQWANFHDTDHCGLDILRVEAMRYHIARTNVLIPYPLGWKFTRSPQ